MKGKKLLTFSGNCDNFTNQSFFFIFLILLVERLVEEGRQFIDFLGHIFIIVR